MGVAYIHSILIIPHKNCISRKKTIADDKIKLTPIQNIIVHTRLKGKARIAEVNRTPVNKTTINNGIIESSKFIADDSTLATGKIYFGIYTFIISEELLTMDISPILVASEKKLKNTMPIIRYAAKFGISDLKRVEKITN